MEESRNGMQKSRNRMEESRNGMQESRNGMQELSYATMMINITSRNNTKRRASFME